MEDFVIIHSKKLRGKTQLERKIDHDIERGEIVCICGGSGVGKSYACDRVLKEYSFVHFDNLILKSKNDTQNLIDKIKSTHNVLYIDDLVFEGGGVGIFFDFIMKPTHVHGPVLINTRHELRIKALLENIDVKYYVLNGPNKRNEIIATTCMKNFGLKVSNPDIEYDTKDNIFDLMCKGGDGYRRLMDVRMEEHGHTADLIFTNYKADTLKEACAISDAFSRSDNYDKLIYQGMWDAIPYFTLEACIIPSFHIKNKLNYEDIVPGAVWTKFCNKRLREKQFRNLRYRHPSLVFDINTISYIMNVFTNSNVNDIISICEDCHIESPDIDFMNHLVSTKLKGKALNIVKKHLKQHGILQRRQQAIRQIRS